MPTHSLTSQSVVRAADNQVSVDLEGEVVILDVNQGIYFGLNPTGAFIWDLIQWPQTVQQIQDALLNHFDVQADQCRRELDNLLGELMSHGLVTIEA